MESLEVAAGKRLRKRKLENAILTTLAIGGIGLVAVAAPNLLKLLKYVDPEWLHKGDPKQRLREVAHRLKKKGLVTFENERGRVRMKITQKGRAEMQRAAIFDQVRRKKKWDGRWRIVIFDIPEKKKQLRQQIRLRVKEFGFQRLQDSVWVFPFDCEELITLLKADLGVGTGMLYIIADAIEYDAPLRKKFGL